jgi:glucose/arabinose dehydrogenase
MRPKSAARMAAAVAVVVTLIAACGGGGGAATSTGASSTTGVSSSSTTVTGSTASVPVTTVPVTTTVPSTTTSAPPVPLADLNLKLTIVVSGLSQPVFAASPPGDDRVFVVEQTGRIQVLRAGVLLGTFLDVSEIISTGGERGLLGLTFHPSYAQNGRFFVDYTNKDGSVVVAEYRVSGDPGVADPASARVMLTVPKPFPNHNGGMVAFGPDGYLYVGLGDGGSGGDPNRNGQNTNTLLAGILRIDVEKDPYGIPPDNPFVGGGGAPEKWAYGLRNPWRFSFDGERLFIGDVGQDAWEEIDVVAAASAGLDFGWSIMEGNHCFRDSNCDQSGLVLPLVEYGHTGGNCSVIGGYVYRGSAIPELDGVYFYGDYCSGKISSFRIDNEGISETRDWGDTLGPLPGLTSFGVDAAGEVYLTSTDGNLYRVDRG